MSTWKKGAKKGTVYFFTFHCLGSEKSKKVDCPFFSPRWSSSLSQIHYLCANDVESGAVASASAELVRPVRVGDVVKIGDLLGRVTRTQIRANTIALFDRSEMIVPNKDFITKTLVNLTLHDSRRRIDIPVRVSYGTSIPKVKKILLEIAERHPEVLKDPALRAVLMEFGDDALKFILMVFVDFGQGLIAKDELQVAIDQAFRDEGIEFALPKLTIQVPEASKK